MCIIFLKSADIFSFILLKLGLILYYDVQIAISFETFSLCVTKSFIFVVLHNFKKLVFESVSEQSWSRQHHLQEILCKQNDGTCSNVQLTSHFTEWLNGIIVWFGSFTSIMYFSFGPECKYISLHCETTYYKTHYLYMWLHLQCNRTGSGHTWRIRWRWAHRGHRRSRESQRRSRGETVTPIWPRWWGRGSAPPHWADLGGRSRWRLWLRFGSRGSFSRGNKLSWY